MGNDWTSTQGKDGKPDKKNSVSRAERVRILKSMNEDKMQPCFFEALIRMRCHRAMGHFVCLEMPEAP